MSDLPATWVLTSVDEICVETRAGVWGDASESERRPVQADIVRNGDITRGEITGSARRWLSEKEATKAAVSPNDVLITTSGHVGKSSMGRDGLHASNFVRILRPDERLVEGRFLRYALAAHRAELAMTTWVGGSTIQNLRSGFFLEPTVPLPPLEEQRRIVEAIEEQFSRLDAADAALRTVISRLKSFERTVIGSLVDGRWAERPLGDVAETVTKGTTPTSLGHSFTTEGILYVKAESLIEGVIDHARCARISEQTDDLLARSRFADSDVLITIAGTLGRVGIVRARDLPANTNQAVCLVRLRDRRHAPWIAAWLRGPRAQTHLQTGGRGVGLQNLNLKQIREISVPLPPLDEQQRIVAQIEQLRSLIDSLRIAVAAAQKRSVALRRAILERAFRGELVPRDPDDQAASMLLERIRAERVTAPKRTRPTRAPV